MLHEIGTKKRNDADQISCVMGIKRHALLSASLAPWIINLGHLHMWERTQDHGHASLSSQPAGCGSGGKSKEVRGEQRKSHHLINQV